VPATKKRKRARSQAMAHRARQSVDNGSAETRSTVRARGLIATARANEKGKNAKARKALIPKEELAAEIATIIRYHHLTQTEAARIVGDAASQLSLLLSGRLEGFSTERLLRMLLRLGRDIEVVLRPASNPRAARFRITHKSALGAVM